VLAYLQAKVEGKIFMKFNETIYFDQQWEQRNSHIEATKDHLWVESGRQNLESAYSQSVDRSENRS